MFERIKYLELLVLAFLLFSTGCASQRGWRYSVDSYPQRSPLLSKKVAVIPFSDSRPDKNDNYFLAYMIPLLDSVIFYV